MLDKSFNETTFSKFRLYLLLRPFLVCPYKLEIFTLSSVGEALCWGRCWLNN